MLNDAVDLSKIQRALVIKLRHHGDVLLSSPVFTVLKNHAAHIEIDALVYADTQEMLTFNPAIKTIFTVDRAWKTTGLLQQTIQETRLLKTLRGRRYDLLIHLTEHPRGAWLSRLLRPRYSVARDFPSKRGGLWRNSFTHLYKVPKKPRHTVEQHLDALRRLGVYPAADERRLTLVPGSEAESSVEHLLKHYGLDRKGFIHIHPASRWLFKCWQTEKYADLINALHETGERVVITGAPDPKETQMTAAIKEKLHRPGIDLVGRLSLKQLAALTTHAKCFVGVDSVPMHIASAMQTPTVALFGPSGDQEWGPWQVRHKIITANYSCRPCGLDGCGGGKVSECLMTLPVSAVINAVREISAL